MQTFRLYLIAIATVVVVVACDRMPLTSPTGSTITLQADRTTLPLNGQTTIRAVVTESGGTPVHNGTTVTFQPNIGTTVPVEATTVNGVATVTFLAGSVSGTGVVNAFSGGARTGSGNTSSTGVTMTIGSAAAGVISVSATPSSVSQSGGTVTVSALVLDKDNNPLPGVSVLFSTAAGTLSATQALTDGSGIARTTLTTTQSATVTAIAGSAKGEVRVEVSPAPNVVIKDPTPASPVAGQPVGITVETSSGNASAPRQIQTLEVEFGDGSRETRANVTVSAAFTHTYRNPGGYTITARAVDVAGNTGVASRAITVGFAPVPTVTLVSSKPNPAVNETFTMTVTANTASGNPPLQSVVVRTNDGTVLYSGSASGAQQFPVVFTSSGTRTITATATDVAGQTASASTVVIVP